MRKLCMILPIVWRCMAVLAGLSLNWPSAGHTQEPWHFIYPEQRHIEVRDPSRLTRARLPNVPPPPTVSEPQNNLPARNLSLDEAIRIALANSNVIRVLTGTSAAPSGSTIYDPAIANTQIDQARGRFDPKLDVQNQFRRRDVPQGVFDPPGSQNVHIEGTRVDDYNLGTGLSKNTVTGGTANLGINTNPTRSTAQGLPLNPQTPSSVDLGYTQPLLQGGGMRANLAPIVIARINTERSFFQMKGSVQELVRGTIEGYWNLVFARVDLWARERQEEQLAEAYRIARTKADPRIGMANRGDVAQTKATLDAFHATVIAARANVLQREDALRNILGLPPADACRLVPITPPVDFRLQPDWNGLIRLTEERRPDIIELKLIIEADQQQLILARNEALPRVDANALYRWDGLQGWTPDRTELSTRPGQFYEWQLGVNFSVPLGLREGRAKMRQQELVLMRDRANLDEGLHAALHGLATTCRNLDQFYVQYETYKSARAAADENLRFQHADYNAGRRIYLELLQAVTNWGNSVTSEAQALAQYNTELANLEQQTGTILETHGIRFAEERYGSIGPLGRLFADRCYPRDLQPGPNADVYKATREPAEKFFDLRNPIPGRRIPETKGRPPESIPAPRPEPPRPEPPRVELPEPPAAVLPPR